MKHLLPAFAMLLLLNCTTSKRNVSNDAPESSDTFSIPKFSCIEKLVEKFKAEDPANPRRKIYQYQYNGSTVYYVTPPCCDFFSDLLDSNCNVIAHPDGGFTGRGDGKLPDFGISRTDEKLIWEDTRK